MEISAIGSSSVKIKGKNAAIVVDPVSKVDAEIVIATQSLDSLALEKVGGARLVISGPGEYEVGGISVSGKASKGGVTYQLLENTKVLFTTSTLIESVPDDENFDCVVIKVSSPFADD